MNSKHFLVLALVLILLLTGCRRQNETLCTTTEVTGTTEGSTATVESIPGVEDSEFDDETEPTATETHTEPTENTETTEPAGNTEPTESVGPEATTPTTEPTQSPDKEQMEYEKFQNMSAADQQAFMGTFENLDLFFAWYNQVKAEYEAAHPPIDVGDGSVDMGDLIG